MKIKLLVILAIFSIVSCNMYNVYKESKNDKNVTQIALKENDLIGQSFKLKNQEYMKYNISLNFSNDGEFSGFSGVNNYFGNYSFKNGKLVLSNYSSTLMLGDKEAQKIEDKFIKHIENLNKVYFENDDLILESNDGTKLIFEKMSRLENKKYKLVSSPYSKYDVDIEFKDGEVYGKSVVNNYFGSYSYENNVLKIGNVASTRVGASKEELNLEYEYFEDLKNVEKVELKSNELNLIMKDGKILKFIEIEN